MAAPPDIEMLRQATIVLNDYNRQVSKKKDDQQKRWAVLRRVIEDAAKQYISMRVDVVEERQMDEGAPLWLSVLITAAITFIPFQALTSVFIEKLSEHTSDLLTMGAKAELDALKIKSARELDLATRFEMFQRAPQLVDKIKNTEDLVIKYAKKYEPEVHHMLVTMAHTLSEAGAERSLNATATEQKEITEKQQENKKEKGPPGSDAPMVTVTQMMHRWIDSFVEIEDSARNREQDRASLLFELATSSDPASLARDKEKDAEDEKAKREPRVPARDPVEALPRTNKEAIAQLTTMRDLVSGAAEPRHAPDANDLRDLQLFTESVIWATTYNFTPIPTHGNVMQPRPSQPVVAPDLSDALWERLITRYIDPDEGKSYAEVGRIRRLGTVAKPASAAVFDPYTRLAYYFSQILYPQIKSGNADIIRKYTN